MDFNEIFINALISTITGIAGGLGVYWFHKGIQLFDGELRFDNKNIIERYLWKFLFIASFLFFMAIIVSILILIVFLRKLFLPPQMVLILAIISGIVMILTLVLRLKWFDNNKKVWKNLWEL